MEWNYVFSHVRDGGMKLFLIFNSSTNSYFPLQTERYLGLSFPSVDAQRAYEEFAYADEH